MCLSDMCMNKSNIVCVCVAILQKLVIHEILVDIAHGSKSVHQVDPWDPNGFIVVCRGRELFFPE